MKKKTIIFLTIFLANFLAGCVTTQSSNNLEPFLVTKSDMDMLRETIALTPAVDLADKIIKETPNKWDEAFHILLDKALRNANLNNRELKLVPYDLAAFAISSSGRL